MHSDAPPIVRARSIATDNSALMQQADDKNKKDTKKKDKKDKKEKKLTLPEPTKQLSGVNINIFSFETRCSEGGNALRAVDARDLSLRQKCFST
jgi:hypothetical protein